MRTVKTAVAVASVVAASAASAKDEVGNPLVAALARCVDIREDQARLSCLDAAARALVTAERSREVIVVDKDRARSTRRSLFGIALGGGDPITGKPETAAERIEQLDTEVSAVQGAPNGRWTITFVEGGRWRTTEPWDGGTTPRLGDKALLRRAALGSYTLRVAGSRVVRVARVN